jgi:hypothetical protein
MSRWSHDDGRVARAVTIAEYGATDKSVRDLLQEFSRADDGRNPSES